MFSDILITSDFDHTLTDRLSQVPQRNIEAIRYFMENGGAFTINTGRSLPMARVAWERVPVNAPLILYNGGLTYDLAAKKIVRAHTIDLDPEATMRKMEEMFPELVTEVESVEAHYLFKENPMWRAFCEHNHCNGRVIDFGDDMGPFLKFCVYGPLKNETVASLYAGTPEEIAFYDEVEARMRAAFGAFGEVYRAAYRIVDVHPKGVSKLSAALELKELLGRKILISIGDGENDVPMLRGADYGFCPADARVGDRFENVCRSEEGAVADVIYKKLPEILEKWA